MPPRSTSTNGSTVSLYPYQASNFLPLFSPGWERRESVDPAIAAEDQDATPKLPA